jgi:hypothetical protein
MICGDVPDSREYTGLRGEASNMGKHREDAMTSLDQRPDVPEDDQRAAGTDRGRATVRQPMLRLAVSPRVIVPFVVVLIAVVGTVLYLTLGGTSHTAGSGTHSVAGTSSAGSAGGDTGSGNKQSVIPPGGVSGSTALNKVGSTALALPPTLRTAAVRWRAGRGGHELTAVSSQLGGTLQAGGVKQYAQMRASCALLAATVAKAQAGPPIPDGTMQALYARSLASLAKGASNCHAAISQQPDGDEYVVTTENQALMHQAASQFSEGAKDLYRATAEIEALGGHH